MIYLIIYLLIGILLSGAYFIWDIWDALRKGRKIAFLLYAVIPALCISILIWPIVLIFFLAETLSATRREAYEDRRRSTE